MAPRRYDISKAGETKARPGDNFVGEIEGNSMTSSARELRGINRRRRRLDAIMRLKEVRATSSRRPASSTSENSSRPALCTGKLDSAADRDDRFLFFPRRGLVDRFVCACLCALGSRVMDFHFLVTLSDAAAATSARSVTSKNRISVLCFYVLRLCGTSVSLFRIFCIPEWLFLCRNVPRFSRLFSRATPSRVFNLRGHVSIAILGFIISKWPLGRGNFDPRISSFASRDFQSARGIFEFP